MFNLNDTFWYCDDEKYYPYNQNVFGFMYVKKNKKIIWDGCYKILDKIYNKNIDDYKYIFCKETNELPRHKRDILNILRKLLEKGKLPIKETIILKIEETGLKFISPKHLVWDRIGLKDNLFSCQYLNKLTNTNHSRKE